MSRNRARMRHKAANRIGDVLVTGDVGTGLGLVFAPPFAWLNQPLGELMGVSAGPKTKRPEGRMLTSYVAEKAGFEPAEGFTPRTLSRRVT